MQSNSSPLISQLVLFSIKAAIAFILFIVAAVVLMPDFTALKYSIRKAAKDEKTRVALMSFIQNPAALYRASEIDEKDGKFNDAVMEMQLAIGLLEMHNADQLVIKCYTDRLGHLNSLLKNANKQSPSLVQDASAFDGKPIDGKPVKRWKE